MDMEVKPYWHQDGQRDQLLSAFPSAENVTSLTQTNVHSSQRTWEKDYLGFMISSFTLLAVPSPSTPQLFMACFCAAIGRSRTVRC